MAKIMIFIDGTWLYRGKAKLAESYGQEGFQVDFGKLPSVLAEEIKKQLGPTEVDVVRTYLFASYPSNYDLRDEDAVTSQFDFFSILKEEYHYELELYPIDFKGRRLKREDRDPRDTFEPREKCVDIALATSILYFAAIPYAYDIAVAVLGDQDYKPVLQYVRRLGKRVAIASIKRSCSPDFSDPRDENRIKDFDIIWLDDVLEKIEFKSERRQLECSSPLHKGDRKVWTTFRLRKGDKFYCDACRTEFSKQKQEAQQKYMGEILEDTELQRTRIGQQLSGKVTKKASDRGFGFIHAVDDKDYFFHLTDLQSGLTFEEIEEGIRVDFEIKKEAYQDRTGAAKNVRRSA